MISCALTGRQILLKFSKIRLVYLAARDKYHLEREDKAGEGYVDFIFYPKKECRCDYIGAQDRQIKCKNCALRFKRKMEEKAKYTGKVLAVRIKR